MDDRTRDSRGQMELALGMNKELTPEYLREIRERCEKATAGPWTTGHDPVSSSVGCTGIADKVIAGSNEWTIGHQKRKAPTKSRQLKNGLVETYVVGEYSEIKPNPTAEFIAHARTDLPAILDAYEEVVKRNEAQKQLIEEHRAELREYDPHDDGPEATAQLRAERDALKAERDQASALDAAADEARKRVSAMSREERDELFKYGMNIVNEGAVETIKNLKAKADALAEALERALSGRYLVRDAKAALAAYHGRGEAIIQPAPPDSAPRPE